MRPSTARAFERLLAVSLLVLIALAIFHEQGCFATEPPAQADGFVAPPK